MVQHCNDRPVVVQSGTAHVTLCIYNLLYISRISLISSAVTSTTKFMAETLVNKRYWLGLEDDKNTPRSYICGCKAKKTGLRVSNVKRAFTVTTRAYSSTLTAK